MKNIKITDYLFRRPASPSFRRRCERRHASKRLRERYSSDNSDSLLRRLEYEISLGNFFPVKISHDSTVKGYVNLNGKLFEVVVSQKTSRIITALPKGSLSAEKTKRYIGKTFLKVANDYKRYT